MLKFPVLYLAAIAASSPLVHSIDFIPSVLADAGNKLSKAQSKKKATKTNNVFEQIAKDDYINSIGTSNKNSIISNGEKPKEAVEIDSKGDAIIEAQRAKASFRYVEDIAPGLMLDMDLHAILHTSMSDVQSVQVIDSYFGRTLVTDGKTQSAEHDEFVYHESLVHPALFWSLHLSNRAGAKDGLKSVFIGGGGELATAREVLRHNTVERIVMVDIDPEVIEVSKKYLPEWGGEAVASHPKVEYIVGDVQQYLQGTYKREV